MNEEFSEFARGCWETLQLHKQGSDVLGHLNNTHFPYLQTQAKWKFVRTPSGLKLTDGNQIYGFSFPTGKEEAEEDFDIEKLPATIEALKQNAVREGTAQIHRASPSSIYLTLQDGRTNPTFNIVHREGNIWRVSPKKRKKKNVATPEQKAFEQGLAATIQENAENIEKVSNFLDSVGQGLKKIDRTIGKGVDRLFYPDPNVADSQGMLFRPMSLPGESMLASIAGGAAIGSIVDFLQRQQDPYKQGPFWKAPAIGAGAGALANLLAKSTFKRFK